MASQVRVHELINGGRNRCWINSLTHILMNIRSIREYAATMEEPKNVARARYFVGKMEEVVDAIDKITGNRYPIEKFEQTEREQIDNIAEILGNQVSCQNRQICNQTWRKVVGDIDYARDVAELAIYDYHHNSRYSIWSATELLYAVSLVKTYGSEILICHATGDPKDLIFVTTAMDLLRTIDKDLSARAYTSEYRRHVSVDDLKRMDEIMRDHYAYARDPGQQQQLLHKPIVSIDPFGNGDPQAVFQACASIHLDENATVSDAITFECASHIFAESAIFSVDSTKFNPSDGQKVIIPQTVSLPSILAGGTRVTQQYKFVGEIHISIAHYTAVIYTNDTFVTIDDSTVQPTRNIEQYRNDCPVVIMMYETIQQPAIDSELILTALKIRKERSSARHHAQDAEKMDYCTAVELSRRWNYPQLRATQVQSTPQSTVKAVSTRSATQDQIDSNAAAAARVPQQSYARVSQQSYARVPQQSYARVPQQSYAPAPSASSQFNAAYASGDYDL